jgi:hypothetical protein
MWFLHCDRLALGIHRNPQAFAQSFRALRRCARICKYVSVHVQTNLRAVNISSDGGSISGLRIGLAPNLWGWPVWG